MNLYWVITEDHDEDWFVIANDPNEACSFHEEIEGYDEGMATAEWILEVSGTIDASVGWPSHDLLRSCGAKFVREKLHASLKFVAVNSAKACWNILYVNWMTEYPNTRRWSA